MRTESKPDTHQRFDAVDALRGFAMVWMTVFHFCFDLNHFGYWRQNFLVDPFWTWQRTAILSLFLFTAGLGQAVAVHQGQSWQRFWRRWAQVALCALLVSAGSYLMYPSTFIYFGVLHGMAVMLVVVRLTAGWGRCLWWLGGLAIAASYTMIIVADYEVLTRATAELFNSKALNWLGFVTRKPATEDFVPLLPWLGVMWWGMAFAKAGAVALLRIADFTGPGNMPSVDFGTALAAKNDNEMSKIATHAAGLDETNQKIFARDAVKILIAKRLRDMPRAILEIDMPDTMKQRMFGEWNAQNPAVSAT